MVGKTAEYHLGKPPQHKAILGEGLLKAHREQGLAKGAVHLFAFRSLGVGISRVGHHHNGK
jgi:hypothetical protein